MCKDCKDKDLSQLTEVKTGPPQVYKPVMEMAEAVGIFKQVTAFCLGEMVDGVDKGTIPGVPKPSLFKPGAEKLRLWFGLIPEFKITTNTEVVGEITIISVESICILKDGQGRIQGSCEANCNSQEDKYKSQTKWLTEKKLPEGIDVSTLQFKEKKSNYDDGTYRVYKLTGESNPYNLLNTIKKMSQKRAFVGAVLMATGTSQMFTQDVEDFKDQHSGDEKSKNGIDRLPALNLVEDLLNSKKISKKKADEWREYINSSTTQEQIQNAIDSLNKFKPKKPTGKPSGDSKKKPPKDTDSPAEPPPAPEDNEKEPSEEDKELETLKLRAEAFLSETDSRNLAMIAAWQPAIDAAFERKSRKELGVLIDRLSLMLDKDDRKNKK